MVGELRKQHHGQKTRLSKLTMAPPKHFLLVSSTSSQSQRSIYPRLTFLAALRRPHPSPHHRPREIPSPFVPPFSRTGPRRPLLHRHPLLDQVHRLRRHDPACLRPGPDQPALRRQEQGDRRPVHRRRDAGVAQAQAREGAARLWGSTFQYVVVAPPPAPAPHVYLQVPLNG